MRRNVKCGDTVVWFDGDVDAVWHDFYDIADTDPDYRVWIKTR